MKKGSTWFLRGVIALMALAALAIAIFALPSMIKGAGLEFPGADGLLYLFAGGLYVSVIPFLFALYQGLRLLTFIDKNQAFTQTAVSALKKIKYCGIIISICYAAGIPYLFYVAEIDDAPGMGIVALVFVCIPLAFSTFATVLQKLFENALNIKSENDLTV